MGKQVIIIGAGVGGLATACLLSKAGYKVKIYEKNSTPGGKAGQFTANGFTFNYGPSWYLMPDIFEHFFSLLGEDVDKLLDLRKLEPSYRVFFKDTLIGSVDINSERSNDQRIFESLEPGAKLALREYLKDTKYLYKTAKKDFLYKNYNSVLDFFTPQMLAKGLRLNVLSNYHQFTSRYFISHELQKIIEFPTMFLGAYPKKTPALYSLLNHSLFSQGVFYPPGGIHKIVETLVEIAKKYNVELIYNRPVKKILIKNKEVTGVRLLNGDKYEADIVISNADRAHSELSLIPKQHRTHSKHYFEKRRLAPSALLIYLGVKGSYKNLRHHNLVFCKDWETNFSEIFDKHKWPADPSFYVCNPSKTDKAVAPKGHENLFVFVPIAAGTDKYDEMGLKTYADRVLDTMEQSMHLPSLKKRIVYKKLFCVKDFQETWNSYQGSALGIAHNLKQSAVFRPSNKSKKVKNLYFVGADTAPGIGLPMCLISAELVYKRLAGNKDSSPLKKL